ncbi:DUF2946 domain-containing protein [Dyella sp. 2HG41-7]|uniref:DUF2946 domain-containing protein n=1 Tax=Dyella sp. 2HG41-7 TaxID=2883239 RepID=UPI001F48D52C
MFKRAAHRRLVAWLGIAAMLLVVVMPLVSRSMPNHVGMDMEMGCHMGMMHGAHHHMPCSPQDPDDPTAHCGYCTLLTHTPVAAFDVPVVTVAALLPALSPQTTTPQSAPTTPWLSARPRGPPRIV